MCNNGSVSQLTRSIFLDKRVHRMHWVFYGPVSRELRPKVQCQGLTRTTTLIACRQRVPRLCSRSFHFYRWAVRLFSGRFVGQVTQLLQNVAGSAPEAHSRTRRAANLAFPVKRCISCYATGTVQTTVSGQIYGPAVHAKLQVL